MQGRQRRAKHQWVHLKAIPLTHTSSYEFDWTFWCVLPFALETHYEAVGWCCQQWKYFALTDATEIQSNIYSPCTPALCLSRDTVCSVIPVLQNFLLKVTNGVVLYLPMQGFMLCLFAGLVQQLNSASFCRMEENVIALPPTCNSHLQP